MNEGIKQYGPRGKSAFQEWKEAYGKPNSTVDDFFEFFKGEKGEPGNKGEKGDIGEKGDAGEKGDRGLRGEKGEKGERGEKGEKGKDGKDGKDGKQGPKGEKGEKGGQGERGLQGERGEKGEKGEQGDQGPKGVDGKDGDKGEKGDKGEIGEQGLQGERGEKGEKGDRGPIGKKGDQGNRGEKGETGLKGPKGDYRPVYVFKASSNKGIKLTDTYSNIVYNNVLLKSHIVDLKDTNIFKIPVNLTGLYRVTVNTRADSFEGSRDISTKLTLRNREVQYDNNFVTDVFKLESNDFFFVELKSNSKEVINVKPLDYTITVEYLG